MEITPKLLQMVTAQVIQVLEQMDLKQIHFNQADFEMNKKSKLLQIGTLALSENIRNKYKIETMTEHMGKNDLSQYEGILVTNLENKQLIELSNGMASDVATTILCEALFLGKSIYIVEEGISYQMYKETANPHFYKLFQDYVEKIKSFGIKVASIETIETRLCKEKSKEKLPSRAQEPSTTKVLLTADAVRAHARSGETTLEIVAGTIITPLAKDVIREKKITILEEKNAYL